MALNLFAIKTRIKDIIENDLSAVTVYTIEPDVAEMKPPCCILFTGTFDAAFVSGIEGKHNVNIEIYWFIRGIQESLATIRAFELDGFIQDFTEAFMSRPRLQLNDNGLTFVQGDIQVVPVVRPTSQVITYPVGFSNGIPFRGFVSRVVVPYRISYEMKA